MKGLICILLILLHVLSIRSQDYDDATQRYFFTGNLGVYNRIVVNETKFSPDYSLLFQFRSRSKYGLTFFRLSLTTSTLAMVFWRDVNFKLCYAHLAPNSSMSRFNIIDKTNDKVTEFITGNRWFSYINDFQEITLLVNSSNIRSRNFYNWTMTLGTMDYQEPIVLGKTYTIPKWDNLLTLTYDQLIPGYYNVLYFIRWEAYHPLFWSFALFVYLINFLLLLSYRNFQPLKSRGIMPYLLNSFQIVVLLVCIFNYFGTVELLARIRCYVRIFFFYPTSLALTLGSVMIFFRYNLFKIINQWKDNVIKTRTGYFSTKSNIIKFYELLQTWFVQLLIFFVFYISWVIVFLIVHLISSKGDITVFHCKPVEYSYWIGTISTLFMMFINFPLSIYLDWDDIKKRKLKNLFFKDPLHFKFEIYVLFSLLVIYSITVQVIFNFAGLVPNTPYHIVGISLQHSIVFAIQCLHPLVRSIIGHIQSCCISKNKHNYLVEILDDPKGMKMMYNYAKSEFAVENVSCYDDILKYEHETDDVRRGEMARKIWDLYLMQGQSMLEVNIIKQQRDEVAHVMSSGKYPVKLFENVKVTLLYNIGDTYSRLLRTSIFAEYRKETAFLKEWHLQEEEVEKFRTSKRELTEPLL